MPTINPLPPVVFFDAVGTLLHPEPSVAAVYAAIGRRHGTRLDEAAIAPRFRAAFRRQEEADDANGLQTSEVREVNRWRAIVRDVLDDVMDGDACFHELYEHFARVESWCCAADAMDVLDTLAARGHVLGIASNFDARLRGLMAQLPALGRVRHLIISSEIGWRKPAAPFFAAMCRLAEVEAENVLYVGDDPTNDHEGGRAAGMRVMLLDPWKRAAVEPSERIATLSDLLNR